MLYFTGSEENMEPVNSFYAVADETVKAIRHLFAASSMAMLPIFYQHGYSVTLLVELKQFSMIYTTNFRCRIFRVPICRTQ